MTTDHVIEIENLWKEAKEKNGENAAASLVIPVIYSGSFIDAEYITKTLAIFMYAAEILKKTSPHHKDYLFFTAAYTALHEKNFPMIQEFYEQVRNAGGYYGSYRGIVLVDVSEWCGHFREKYFDVFLAYLADMRLNGVIPFIYTNYCDSESAMQELETVVSFYFDIRRICVNEKDLSHYAVSLLEEQEIRVDESIRPYLEDFFRESKKSDLFHGTESVRHICREVADRCDHCPTHSSLDKEHLEAIITDLGFSDIYCGRSRKIIGFR